MMEEYRALADDGDERESFLDQKLEELKRKDRRRSSYPAWITKLSLALNVLLLLGIFFAIVLSRQTSHSSQVVYSPAQSKIRYMPYTFSEHGLSRYAAVGPEADAAWNDLYAHGISIISKKEAQQMAVQSYPWVIEGQPTYLTELAVYHQLHCVNMFRRHLLSNDTMVDTYHLVHCVDDLREAIQCASDITPLFAKPNPGDLDRPLLFYTDTPHSCRDFESVQEWARGRQVPPGAIVKSVHENNLNHDV
ncbi:hypothetical protein C8R45DRAFT_256452 [Mycena sanguinolenta]|nr:hypothetical protein C8R45DRAFT_256452 [Mycena sanguinolenta]